LQQSTSETPFKIRTLEKKTPNKEKQPSFQEKMQQKQLEKIDHQILLLKLQQEGQRLVNERLKKEQTDKERSLADATPVSTTIGSALEALHSSPS
jgi:hypothetical protein